MMKKKKQLLKVLMADLLNMPKKSVVVLSKLSTVALMPKQVSR
jgi:hypothetical protein